MVVALGVWAVAGEAFAQGLEAQRFVPAAGAAGGLQVERPVVPAHLAFGMGAFLNYARDTVSAPGAAGGGDSVFAHALGLDLVGSLGLYNFAEIALHLPLQMYLGGETPAGAGGNQADVWNGFRLVPKVSLGWIGDPRSGLAFGLAAPVVVPAGGDGRPGPSVEPRLLAMFYGTRWAVNASGGYRWRRQGPTAVPDELTVGLAGTWKPPVEGDVLEVILEVSGSRLLTPGPAAAAPPNPVEALGALVCSPPGMRFSFYAGAGAGLTNGPGMPDFRVLGGVRYTVGVPERGRSHDSDSDGVPDYADRCLREPEDLDAFQDEDGCPEADNDKDGVADDDDECPDDAEERGGDRDGCPDRPRVVIRRGKMVIYGKVLFPLESANLLPRNGALIDEMARALEEHPGLRRVEIEGHTDNSGEGDYNVKLSQERAEVVKRALERRAVDGKRLVPRGYGEQRPVAPNVTRAGRAKNRRVEFTILQD